MVKNNKTIYLCEQCGNEFPVWSGKCPMCGEWNTLKELNVANYKVQSSQRNSKIEIRKLAEITSTQSDRMKTGIKEFDRVLGGGIVSGSIILLGGEPGIGKSTLLLQVASAVKKTIYLSAEESAPQIKIRADRLGLQESDIMLISEGEIEGLEPELSRHKPELLIVDSIQTVYMNSYDATPGSLIQVRESGIFLQRLAKRTGVPIMVIGHVTKEGNLAGPRILEHLVDVVLYLEGERFNDARILRGVKNRFGATDEVGIFSMQTKGMIEVKNPSELFLSERIKNPGSVVTVTLEGTRPLLVEIQALVIPTNFGYPRRTSSGFDLNRLNLLAAVISKNGGINLNNSDIYLNVAGGLKVSEPAADLAVCAAIISSYKNKTVQPDCCLFGEVGLLGEVRRVTKISERTKEAKTLGFNIPSNVKSITDINKLLV